MSSLSHLACLRNAQSRRASSFDRTGGNRDFWAALPGETLRLAEIDGAGCIRHIWMTIGGDNETTLGQRLVLRMYWDGEAAPSVEAPVGDFFGMGFGMFKDFVSAPLQMSPAGGRGMNCWFPMPFCESARIEITNEGQGEHHIYFYIDYEQFHSPEQLAAVMGSVDVSEVGYFHAQWRRENPTDGWMDPSRRAELHADIWKVWQSDEARNQTGEGNYTILAAVGRGHYVGCNLHIDCFDRQVNDWYGEGDDMIFIDGDAAPTIHGTGTEDYFCMAYCPRTEYSAPYHGLILYSGTEEWPWRGKNSMYRYHVEDPIHFRESIRVTIEHGHGNKLTNDYSSTAYWYQTEPHAPFPELLPVEKRLPRP